MKRVPKSVEESNAIPTAKRRDNNTAFTGSVPDGNVSNRGGEGQKKVHSFSKKLANAIYAKKRKLNSKAKNACHEATLLKYLANRVSTSKHIIEGKKWFYTTIEKLAEQFPYFGNTTAYDLVMSLNELEYLEIGNFNRYKYDRTLWFHVSQKVCHAAEEDLIYFDAAVAKDVGVVAAVLHRNFEYWMDVIKKEGLDLEVEMSPAKLSELLPFSESTIKRGLKQLEDKYFKRLSDDKPLYGILENSRGSNPNAKGSNPNGIGSNPNDYTYWKPVSNPLETPSKAKPAASVFDHPADDTKANDEQGHLFNDGIAPCADEQDRKEMGHENVAEPASDSSSEPAQATSTGSENNSSSTSDIPGEAFDVKGEWPDVPNYEYLHSKNQSLSAVVREMENMPGGVRDSLLSAVHDICITVLSQVDQQITDELYENRDKEEIVQTMLPYHQQFFTLSSLTTEHALFDILYYGSLEAMVGAMLWEVDPRNKYSHPMTMLNNVTYRLHLVFWRRAEDLRTKAVDDEFAQWRQENASVDAHKANDPSLSPAEKMRVFRNALNTRNKVGWIWFDQTHQTQRIQVSKLGLQRIQELFELNSDLTPAELLPIMDGCMNEYSGRPAPPKKFRRGIHWHARMGHRLHIFASYLETIVKQLGMQSPVEVYLSGANIQEEDGVALAA